MTQTQRSLTAPAATGALASWDQPAKKAVLYLRVSTSSQVNTDRDPEGISIPAQRVSCERKAAQLGIEIVDEYVEPGRSATSMDKREAFQKLLERIRTDRDIDYVIVYKLSRMNRNRLDDAKVLVELRRFGVTLVSATEQIDDTPVGQLMHGILAAFNEFRSAEDGADISYKMGEKARRGGTLGRAPLGYLNVAEEFEGREFRSIAVDPDRAPLVQRAFELYATNDYTMDALAEKLEALGLRTRPGRHPAQPLSANHLQTMLRNRYYLGFVTFKGEEYEGRHPAIVEPRLFEKVQQVMASRGQSQVRKRVHDHYLKGMLWCFPCYKNALDYRLIRQQSNGNGGTYEYFFCRGRQEHQCDARHIWVDEIEDAVLDFYAKLKLPAAFVTLVREKVTEVVNDEYRSYSTRKKQIKRQLDQLATKEENLIDLAADGGLPSSKVRNRLWRISEDRSTLQEELVQIEIGLASGAQLIEDAMSLLDKADDLYRNASDEQRRLLNRALFKKLYLRDDEVVTAEFNEPFDELISARDSVLGQWDLPEMLQSDYPICENKTARLETALCYAGGSSKTVMVGAEGLEPPTC